MFILLLWPFFSNAQQVEEKFKEDTLYMDRVRVPYTGLTNPKTGKPNKIWYKTIIADSGYIIKLANGNYLINGIILKPDYLKLESY